VKPLDGEQFVLNAESSFAARPACAPASQRSTSRAATATAPRGEC